jgi:exopolysaccharide biosynthesis polyprenyl glycosylphosphotransferase
MNVGGTVNTSAVQTPETEGASAVAREPVPRFAGVVRRRVSVRALLAVDLAAAIVLLSLMYHGGGHGVLACFTEWRDMLALAVAVAATMLGLGALGAYNPATRLPGVRLRTCSQLLLLACTGAVVAALVSDGANGTLDASYLVCVALGLSGAWIGARALVSVAERRHPLRTIIIGTGSTAQHVWELSLRHRECGFQICGFVDDDPLDLPPEAPGVLGGLGQLRALVIEHDISRVVVAYAKVDGADLVARLRSLDERVDVQVVPRLFELVQARGFELGRLSLLEAGGVPPAVGERVVKRVFDIVGASLALLLAAPLLAAIAIAIKLDDGGPVLFRQRRVGRGGGVFEIVKFRTMASGTDQHSQEIIVGLSIEDAVRELKLRSVEMYVTRVGRWLRARSLDELPQLWNVLRGDMGLVGPRPMPEYEAEELAPWQARARHSVRPGITGLWQVSGRSSLTWDERVQLDCVYTRHWSVTSDLRILARTVAVVMRRGDAV